MSQAPRRLTFAVGTSLLTVSLVSAACAKPPIVNTRPPEPEEHVNEGPETEAPETEAPESDSSETDAPEPEQPEDGPNVNTVSPGE